jgi:putative FmdB family regulatory protein
MPTYEYQCPAGHAFDLFQKMSGRTRVKCPTCGKLAIRKISGGAGLVFKGSGFYITDYGKDGKGPRKQEAGDKPAASGSDKGEKPGVSGSERAESAGKDRGEAEPKPKSEKAEPSPAKSTKSGKKKAAE